MPPVCAAGAYGWICANSGHVIGIISAVGAFGGFLVPIAYAEANKHFGTIAPALQFYVGVFVVMAVVTWFCYLRPGARMASIGA